MTQKKVTPMMAQYLAIKENYQDSILFYRMGDFYEMFFEDAETASRLLEITLTSRDKKSDAPIPMCGIPVKAADSYIARLISKGVKVAVCEQVEDPSSAKGIVRREVVRVVTPGMILDNALLDEKSNNYILALTHGRGGAGIAYLDISTGTFRLCEAPALEALLDEVLRIAPSELLLPESLEGDPALGPVIDLCAQTSITHVEDENFNFKKGRGRLTEQFNTRSLEGFGCEGHKLAVGAAGALLVYVQETQLREIEHLKTPETYVLSDYLTIDDSSCRNLELTTNIRNGSKEGTLLSVIDKTVTAMAGRLLKSWIRYPLLDRDAINARLDAVEEARDNITLREAIRENLKSVYDLERLTSKISMGQSNARDLTALKHSLKVLPELWINLAGFRSPLFSCDENITELSEVADLIDRAIREDAPPTLQEGNLIRNGFHDELDELIRLTRDGKSWIAELEVTEKKKTGLSSLKVKYNKVFGYFIEISKAQSKDVPDTYIRKQTLVNAERYITEDLKNFETKVMEAQDKRFALEYELFTQVREEVVRHREMILKVAGFLAVSDCLLNMAHIADHNNYTRPHINTAGAIEIDEGRHPVVEKMLNGERYVPNTIRLDNEKHQVIVITGPNMAGKSTVLRQVALISIMAQMGSFVPATAASLCVTDRIFTRVGALDNLSQGQSTFMVEMEETANIMNNATPNSLIIMDEIGRGTSTFDGLSIAWAVAEYLHDLNEQGVKTLFATHYHELTELEATKERVRNFNIAVKEWNDNIIFLRKLVEGGTNRSYGIQVARLAGVPGSIIQRAKEILTRVESQGKDAPPMSEAPEEKKPAPRPAKKTGKKHVQLNLFPGPESALIEKIMEMDIAAMTPLEALNRLSELKDDAAVVLNS